jgi:hypothetical protein
MITTIGGESAGGKLDELDRSNDVCVGRLQDIDLRVSMTRS